MAVSVLLVRRATAEDALAVAELWLRARRAAVPVIPAPVHTDDEVRQWFAEVVLPDEEVWVADDGGVVGLLVLEGDEVGQLYVDPTGSGIGSTLLDHAKALRPGGLRLTTFESNLGARRFYDRHGFQVVGGTAGDNEEGAPDLHLAWPGRGDGRPGGRPPHDDRVG